MASSTSSKPSGQQQPQTIDLNSLPTEQLNQIKSQLTQELQHLTTSFQQLKAAQTKFKDCIVSIRDGLENRPAGTPLLVPLTPSLYLPATLSPPSPTISTITVLVDIGTGFYVSKTPPEAREFYKRKVEELGRNLVDLEKIVQGKKGSLDVVDGVVTRRAIEGGKDVSV